MNKIRLKLGIWIGLVLTIFWSDLALAQSDQTAKSILDKASGTMSAYSNLSMGFNTTREIRSYFNRRYPSSDRADHRDSTI